jgi:hypothetical protein
MPLALPIPVQDRVAALHEASNEANRVVLVLNGGRTIHDLGVAWAKDAVRVGGKTVGSPSDLEFDPKKVIGATK